MKSLLCNVCIAVCLLVSVSSFAQQSTEKNSFLFNKYPAIITCTETQLNSLFDTPKGGVISLSLQGGLKLNGPVLYKSSKYNNLETMGIMLPEFNHMMFSVSKRLDINNKPVYAGHLICHGFADSYELKHNKDNSYQFIKVVTEQALPKCNH
jgi:hypothetical protein